MHTTETLAERGQRAMHVALEVFDARAAELAQAGS
jgi:hypothetical protein